MTVAIGATVKSLGKYHALDNRSLYILKFILEKTYGSFAILSSQDYKQIAIDIRICERRVRNRIETMEKYGFLNIDKTQKPYKIFILSKGKDIATCDGCSKATVKSFVLSHQPSNIPTKIDWLRPHEIWLFLSIQNPWKTDPVVGNPSSWNSERDKIIKMNFENRFTLMELKNNNIYEFPFESIMVRSTPHGFILKVFSDKSHELFYYPEKATLKIFSIVETITPKLENMFKVKLSWDNKIMAEISKESYAVVHNEFARQLLDCKDRIKEKTGIKIDVNVIDENGNILYRPDKSLGVFCPEADTDDLLYAKRLKDFCSEIGVGRLNAKEIEDNAKETALIPPKIDNLLEHAQLQLKHLTQMSEYLEKQSHQISLQAENIASYEKQINVHMPALIGIKETTDKLGPAIEQMTKLIKMANAKIAQRKITEFAKKKRSAMKINEFF